MFKINLGQSISLMLISIISIFSFLLLSSLPFKLLLGLIVILSIVGAVFCNKLFRAQYAMGVLGISCVLIGLNYDHLSYDTIAFIGKSFRILFI